jgi:predicted N-acyltransferase
MQKEGHPLNWFYNNFDVLLDRINDSEKDQQLRKERRAQTALLRQEWLNGNA